MIRILSVFLFCCCASRAGERPYLSTGAWQKLVENLTCSVEAEGKKKIVPRKYRYGKSAQNRPLEVFIIEPEPESRDEAENVYLIAAQHGDERNTTRVLEYFLREVRQLSRDYRNERRILIIPLYNPDGYKKKKRLSAEDIDLNRDFPTKDGAKENPQAPETRAFLRLLDRYPPMIIYNLHQPFRVILADREYRKLAEPFAKLSDYPLGEDVGYPTPGSLGTYGRENGIPVITVELARSMKKAAAPFIFEEVRLALFHAAFGCIPRQAYRSRLEEYLAE
ncbi:MAG: M14 family zinc carboxypeptidase [Leptospiraceae bacterium]|nr:M14 family zinc carboxypeptidase [Leptospiraceae bacterium]